MPRKSEKNPKEPVRKDLEESPEKKKARPNLFEDDSSHQDDDADEFLRTHHAPTKISQEDPLSSSQIQRQAGMSDEEWEEKLRMSRKQFPGIKIPSPTPARKRRQTLKRKLQAQKLFNEGHHYKTSLSPRKLEVEKFDQLLPSSEQDKGLEESVGQGMYNYLIYIKRKDSFKFLS